MKAFMVRGRRPGRVLAWELVKRRAFSGTLLAKRVRDDSPEADN